VDVVMRSMTMNSRVLLAVFCLAWSGTVAAQELPCQGVADSPCGLDIPELPFQRVPPVFQFQARIAQVKLPKGNAVLDSLVVKLSSGGKVLCSEKITSVEVRDNVLNLTIGQNIDCELDEVIAEHSNLLFQVCMGGDSGCLKPIELAATPFALKTTYASQAMDADRANVAGQSVWALRATADKELFLRKELGTGYFDFYSHVEGDTQALFDPGLYDPQTYPWKFEDYESGGFIQWTPVRNDEALNVHVAGKDVVTGKTVPLTELVLAADLTTMRGDLTIEPEQGGEGLVIMSDGLHVKDDSEFWGVLDVAKLFQVEGGLLVSGDATVDKQVTVGKATTVSGGGFHLLADADVTGALLVVGGMAPESTMDTASTSLFEGLLTAGNVQVASGLTVEGSMAVEQMNAGALVVEGLLNTQTASTVSDATLQGGLSVAGPMLVGKASTFHGEVDFQGSYEDSAPDFRYLQAVNEVRPLTFGGALTFGKGARMAGGLDMASNRLKRFRVQTADAAPAACTDETQGLVYFDTLKDTLLFCSNGEFRDVAPTTQCGNSYVEPGEECDDGGVADGDGCAKGCTVEPDWACTPVGVQPSACTTCGDGVILAGEGCDDGNEVDGDGCSAACKVEAKWSCSGEPSACVKVCGDGGKYYAGTNHCYKTTTVMKSHSDARNLCSTAGRYMVVITSKAENDFVISLLGTWGWIWQGVVKDTSWKYVAESPEGSVPLTWSNWAPGEPNGSGTCGNVVNNVGGWTPGTWDDTTCSSNAFTVCEWSW